MDINDEGANDLSENLSEIFSVCRECMKSTSETGKFYFINTQDDSMMEIFFYEMFPSQRVSICS